MVLLDINCNVGLKPILNQYLSIPVKSAHEYHWGLLTNGELVAAAVGAGFTSIVTNDRAFIQSAEAALVKFPSLSVVIFTFQQMRHRDYLAHVETTLQKQPLHLVAGKIAHYP